MGKLRRKLYVPFGSDNAGFIAHTPSELTDAVSSVLKSGNDPSHKEGRKTIKERYFGKFDNFGSARRDILKIIDAMIAGTYRNEWQSGDTE